MDQLKGNDQNVTIVFISRDEQKKKVSKENCVFGMSITHIRYASIVYYILYKYECWKFNRRHSDGYI